MPSGVYPRKDIRQRFYSHIIVNSDNECWEWQGAKDHKGYGRSYYKGKTVSASRLSWILEHGDIPEDMHVLHTCDNPVCINPNHLFIGTNLDNKIDQQNKGRTSHGEQHWNHKLNAEKVIGIRVMKQCKIRTGLIAKFYSISMSTVCDVIARRTWKGV